MPEVRDVALFGAAGYSGLELAKLVEEHTALRLACAASDHHAGKLVSAMTGRRHEGNPAFIPTAAARERAQSCQLAFLAVPPEATLELAPALRAAGVTVVDLSNAYRGFDEVPYGYTSIAPNAMAGVGLIANPGCYATAVITAAAPLVADQLLLDDFVAVTGASGVTGAGRKADEALSMGEMFGEMRAYRVLKHQHVPEIERCLATLGRPTQVALTTHLLPIARGILVTLTARLAAPLRIEALVDRYQGFFANDPTVVVQPTPEDVTIKRVVGTPQCHVGIATNERGVVVVTAALDNLLKGAASQAMENANLALGMPRMMGLEHLARHA